MEGLARLQLVYFSFSSTSSFIPAARHSTSMEKTFANLLRHSRLATYDRRLNQVYHTPKQSKHRGDWGVKRNLPTVIRTPYVTIGQLDTAEHQTPWDSGHSQVAFLRRWKENFGTTNTSSHRTRTRHHNPLRQQTSDDSDDYYNLASMTRSQFNHFIQHTITPETVDAFQNALRTNQITEDQVYDYLNISFKSEPSIVMGPFYSHATQQHATTTTIDDERVVEGRILNTQKGGYAVGIGGVVALLPKRFAVGIKKPGDRLLVRKFFVRHAYIDDQGKPQVIVSLQPKAVPTTLPPLPSPPSSRQRIDISQTLSLPTSALPSALKINKKKRRSPTADWTAATFDDMFGTTTPPDNNTFDDLQLFLLGQGNGRSNPRQMASNEAPSSTASSHLDLDQHSQQVKSKEEMLEDHTVLMNRIIALLKNGSLKKN